MRAIAIILLFLFIGADSNSQRRQKAYPTDRLSGIRQFLGLCNAYRTAPLYLDIEVRNGAIPVSVASDTSSMEAMFFVLDHMTYTRYQDIEQLSDDSTRLLVNNTFKRIVFSPIDNSPADNANSIGMTSWQNVAIEEMAKAFKIEKDTILGDTGVIAVASRSMVNGTSFPRQTIAIFYSPGTKEIFKVVTQSYRLTIVSQEQLNQFGSDVTLKGRLVDLDDGSKGIIVENWSEFVYKKISRDPKLKIPLKVKDIGRRSGDQFVSNSLYRDYSVIQN